MGEGAEFAKRNSKYVSWENGVVEGVLEERKAFMTTDRDGEEIEKMRYVLDGKILTSASGKLAIEMDNIELGQKVKITKTGEGFDTKYEVSAL